MRFWKMPQHPLGCSGADRPSKSRRFAPCCALWWASGILQNRINTALSLHAAKIRALPGARGRGAARAVVRDLRGQRTGGQPAGVGSWEGGFAICHLVCLLQDCSVAGCVREVRGLAVSLTLLGWLKAGGGTRGSTGLRPLLFISRVKTTSVPKALTFASFFWF